MRSFLTLLITIPILFAAVHVMAAAKITLHYEMGSYNKGYKEYEFGDNLSSPSLMMNFGMECKYKDSEGHIVGGGIVETTIKESSARFLNRIPNPSTGDYKYIKDDYLMQPSTSITVPYFFVGQDFNSWGLELGISYYLHVEDFQARKYIDTDNSEITKDNGGYDLNRRESTVYLNMMARILPEDFIHFKIRFGRESFNAVDSFFNTAVVFPFENHTLEMNVSFGLGDYLKNNQRVGLAYSYKAEPFFIGLSANCLISNERAGDGNSVDFLNRLSMGLQVGVAW
ncbi:MAG: hypothetical protein GY754_42370 [bacterium]|nr:hypothetical protein [bacterium]